MKIHDEESEYETISDLLRGLKEGRLLVHTRVADETDFKWGIDPSAGSFLRSTEAWQTADELYGSGPELIFFCDDLSWSSSSVLKEISGNSEAQLQLIFVRNNSTIFKYVGSGLVIDNLGKEIKYELCGMADYQDPLFASVPAGVELGDWFTNKSQDVVATVPVEEVEPHLKKSGSKLSLH